MLTCVGFLNIIYDIKYKMPISLIQVDDLKDISENNLQGVSKKTEFSGKQPWQIQLLWVGNTVGFFYKSRLCCFLTTSFPGRCVNNIYVHSRIHNNKSTANFCD